MKIEGKETTFNFGDEVYLVAALGDEELLTKGLITRIDVHPGMRLLYQVAWADSTVQSYYDFELTTSKFESGVDAT